jgi:hypothetical protein
MKSINLKKVSSILMRVLFILFVLCLVIGLIDGIRNNNWDVFYGCLVGFLLIFFLRIIYDVIELIVRRFTNHENTLGAIFKTPDPVTLKWWRIKSLLTGYGAKSIHGKESRSRFELNCVIITFHRPDGQKEARSYQVRDIRRFLEIQR